MWLALYFPQLPIDRQDQHSADEPRAVILHEGPRKRIMACNPCAEAHGVRAGLALKNAYALVPNLLISDFDETEQAAHLEQLTLWALQYSSWVCPESPDIILLEIAASLKLFEGLDGLLHQVSRGAKEQGVHVLLGIAPTPKAAELFAKAGMQKPIINMAALLETLAGVPVSLLPLDDFTLKGLRQSGIQTLGELRAIAPAALTRRFGSQCTQLLYKLDGRLPDPKEAYKAAESFSHGVDLPLEAPDTGALAFPLNRLLGALGGYLKTRDLGVRHLDVVLYHHKRKATRVPLKFLDATSNIPHLFRIATERLDAVTLDSPVIRLGLESTELDSLEQHGRDLFQKSQAQSNSIEQVLDKLVARLGKEALYTALPGDDHRPEKAWMTALLERQQPPTQWPARPVWLLREPQPLSEDMTLHTLPERIENGWWDETDVRRDYFIASTKGGAYYWVYRQRHHSTQYWIHGLFS